MKIFINRILTTVFILSMSGQVVAGGVAGGGGPPAREELETMLQGNRNVAKIFLWDKDRLGLGTDAPLKPEIVITRGTRAITLKMSDDDFDRVMDQTTIVVQAVNLNGEIRAYYVDRRQAPEVLILVAPI